MKHKRYLLLIPLAPGWIIPRLIGTVAFLTHPTFTGLLAIVSWWLVVPLLWIVGVKGLRKLRMAYYRS